MTDEQFAEILTLAYERSHVEFKGPGALKDQPLGAKVARAAQGISNRRNGGYIILGVEEQDGVLDPRGLSKAQVASWLHYDNVRDMLNSYADPPIQFDIEEHPYQGKQFVILIIHEFDDYPVVCKKHYLDPSVADPHHKRILRDGACYVRPRRKNETVEVPSAVDMHDLLALAIEKGVQRFVAQARASGMSLAPIPAPADDAFTTERGTPWDNSILSKIRTRGYWQVIIHPGHYARERIVSLPTLTALVERSQLHYSGWDFPHIESRREIVPGVSSIEQAYQAMHHLEAWRFFQSGQFVDVTGIPYDWRDETTWWPADMHWKTGQAISVEEIVKRCTEIFDFAAHLATADEYHATGQMDVGITLHGLKGRTLYIASAGKVPLRRVYTAEIDTYPYEATADRDALIAHPRDHALRAAIAVLNRFGWDPAEGTVRSIQDAITT